MERPDLDELGADWWEAYTELRTESVWFCRVKGCAFPARKNHKCKKHGGKGRYKATTPLDDTTTEEPLFNKGIVGVAGC